MHILSGRENFVMENKPRTMRAVAVLSLAVLIGWPMAAPAQTTHTLPLVRPADFSGQESLVRIVNRSATSGTVRITAIDDTGRRFGPVTLTLGARQALNITSGDLERGNAAKGLPVGVGNGSGSWRLELVTALTIEPLAYIRTPDGFLTSMHDEAPVSEDGSHWVPFFNPGSNTSKVSHLRIINPGATAATVTVTGRDAAGDAGSGTVSLTLPAGAARTLSAQDFERGGAGFSGRLGDGAGKWRLNVRSSGSIQVMSLLSTRTGHLANLSTAPSYAGGVAPPPPPPPGDDHGDTLATATVVGVPSTTAGRLEEVGDLDVFRFELSRAGRLQVQTTGGTDTFGVLGRVGDPASIALDDDSGTGANFRITQEAAQAGSWSVAVAGYEGTATGAYTLQVELSGAPPPSDYVGAIAVGWVGESCSDGYGWNAAWNYRDRDAAVSKVEADCRSRGLLRCAWAVTFSGCGALAYGESGTAGCGLRGGYGATRSAAESHALSRCREDFSRCTTPVDSSSGRNASYCNDGAQAARRVEAQSDGYMTEPQSGTSISGSRLIPERSPRRVVEPR